MHKSDDEFLSSKQEHYLNLARNTTLFALAISNDMYKSHPNGTKWLDVMALNILNKFGVPNEDLAKYFESLIFNTNIKNMKASKLLDYTNNWIDRFKLNNWQSNYLVDESLGVCDILKKIPLENPNFLKISRPGFSYDETAHDFIQKDLYNLKTKELVPSLQKFKKNR